LYSLAAFIREIQILSLENKLQIFAGYTGRLLYIMLAFFEHFNEAKALSIIGAF